MKANMCRVYTGALIILNIVFCAKAKIFLDTTTSQSSLQSGGCFDTLRADYLNEINGLILENSNLRDKLKTTSQRFDKIAANAKTAIQTIKELRNINTVAKVIESCSEVRLTDEGLQSAVYTLKVPGSDVNSFPVLCLKDPYNGPAWTVIQRRQDGSLDFYRDWNDYAYGFGNPYGEQWLGLDRIHALTSSRKHELWIQFEDFDGGSHYAKYDEFLVGDRKSKYELLEVGKFYGNAGQSLSQQKNKKFTTKDADNDLYAAGNCATYYKGAWWYANCYNSNLNGRYSLDSNGTVFKGIQWNQYRTSYNLKYVHMAIRPASD